MILSDGLANLTTSLGTDKDKARATGWYVNVRTPDQFESLYRASAFARKIVDIPTADMLRRWRGWSVDDKIIGAVEATEKRFRVRQTLAKAHRWARLYGSSAIIIGVNPRLGPPDTPLDLARLQPGDLSYLHVDIYPRLLIDEWEDDITQDNFGQPRMYRYAPVVRGANSNQVRIHASRVIPFSGMPLPALHAITTQGWGDSVFTALEDTLATAGTTTAVISSMLHEAKQDIISTDLSGIGTPDGEARVKSRFALANYLKSVNNMLLLGNDEKYDQKTLTFAGLPDIHIRMLQELSGAADIPATRFLGQAPAGLNATGDADLHNYYDSLSAKQEDELTDPANRIDAVLLPSAGITLPPEAFWFWHSLWQETEAQKADNGLKRAQAFKIHSDSGAIPDLVLHKALVSQLVEAGTYPALESAMKEYEDEFGEGKPGDFAEPEEGADPEGDKLARSTRPLLRVVGDAAPRSLYVSRKVENAAEILAWAKGQGFAELVPAGDLHVTVMYSRTPVDWFALGTDQEKIVVPRGGPRAVEQFDEGAIVIQFADWSLSWRNESLREQGCSWDHDGFNPHITFTKAAGSVDLSKVQAYQGKIVLGPEVFAETGENRKVELDA